jgi:hypothetical protein
MRKVILLIIIVYCSLVKASCQDLTTSKETIKKFSLQANIGTALLYNTYSGYIEYIIIPQEYDKKGALLLKSGFGYFDEVIFSEIFKDNYNSKYVNFQLGFISGIHKNHHFEASGGINLFFDNNFEGSYSVAFLTGYRYQKPQSNFMFRAGTAFPEGLYLGIGFAF